MSRKNTKDHRLSTSQKYANKGAWFKEKADELDTEHSSVLHGNGQVSEFKRMKVNCDLFNNKPNLEDFNYVCQPYGAQVGETNAQMVNRDITSGKIKALMGMEMKNPFLWTATAVNPEATTRKEREIFGRMRDYVISQIMEPIEIEAQNAAMQESKGRELTPQEQEQIQAKVKEQVKAMTPEEVKKYMEREHQDPAEVLAQQILTYLTQKEELKYKFSEGFKYSLLTAKEMYHVGITNGHPKVTVVNPIRFSYDRSPDLYFIEDGEWAVAEYRMKPSQVVSRFSRELKDKEIDQIYEEYGTYRDSKFEDSVFDFSKDEDFEDDGVNDTVRVLHCVFKSLRKIQFLTYLDENQAVQKKLVSEEYEIRHELGDLNLEAVWIPEAYEVWKIGNDIYKGYGAVAGHTDLDNIYECKLPYYGAVYDATNSQPTSIMDRLKMYQYLYNIIFFRIETLLASDKGKKVLMNINSVPDTDGMDLQKWQYFFENTPFMWYDPNQEGTGYTDVNTVAKEIDFSLASDIGKYINLAEYLREQAGLSVGINPQVEGQVSASEAVGNVQGVLMQSSNILEPYFSLHNSVKRNVLQALIGTAKVAYEESSPEYLSYVLDDMSSHMIKLNKELLSMSSYGIFVSNSAKSIETKDLIRNLAHAALQNQKVELSDVISIIRQENIIEAEETLKVAESNRRDSEQMSQQQQAANVKELEQMRQQAAEEEHVRTKELIILKEGERRKTEIVKTKLMGASFNPDLDKNDNGRNDFLEIADKQLGLKVKQEQAALDREKFEHQKKVDSEKLSIDKKKLSQSSK